MAWDPIEYLKGKHTRELLLLRNACHKFHGHYDIADGGCCFITHEQVRDELNTREHIPRGKEAKLLRRLMAQNHMTAEQVRAVPKFATELAMAQTRRVVSAETYQMYKQHAPNSWVTKKMVVLAKDD